jgi:hypothetical protein
LLGQRPPKKRLSLSRFVRKRLGERAVAVVVAIAMMGIEEVRPNTEIIPVMARLAPTETAMIPPSRRQWR